MKQYNDQYKRLDALFSDVTEHQDFNGNILILENGKTLYKNTIGYSNLQTREPLTDDTVFELASVSKAFTAMGIMILQEKGKLDYDDTIDHFVPDFPYQHRTIHQLLTHTSGLPDYIKLFDEHWDKTKVATNQDVLDQLQQHQPKPLFQPNERYEYSNTGYVLLASIIECITDVSFSDFMKQNIFDVLDMERTLVYNGRYTGKKISQYAYGHVYSPQLDQYIIPDHSKEHDYVIYLDGIQGDGVVNSTMNDLAKWDRALYTEKLVKKETLQKAFTPIVKIDHERSSYGYGWKINESNDTGKVVFHSGSWPGYRTWLSRYIDQDKTIIYLTNVEKDRQWTEMMMRTIEDILFGRPMSFPRTF